MALHGEQRGGMDLTREVFLPRMEARSGDVNPLHFPNFRSMQEVFPVKAEKSQVLRRFLFPATGGLRWDQAEIVK